MHAPCGEALLWRWAESHGADGEARGAEGEHAQLRGDQPGHGRGRLRARGLRQPEPEQGPARESGTHWVTFFL